MWGYLGFARKAVRGSAMVVHGEVDREADGRWIVEITDLPGVLAYGATEAEATQQAIALALRVLADRVEQGQLSAPAAGFSFELNLQSA